jgi:hypothetical protein
MDLLDPSGYNKSATYSIAAALIDTTTRWTYKSPIWGNVVYLKLFIVAMLTER